MSRSEPVVFSHSMVSLTRKIGVVVIALGILGGCRFKGIESFESATTVPAEPRTMKGDPGDAGGIAMASGGTKTATPYGEGASLNSSAPLVPSYDQAAKGSGQQPGEGTIEAAPGYGHDNGPAFQNPPGAVSSTSTRSKI